jgi:hypothetical protein
MRIAPTAHSPPNPNPISPRKMSSCVASWANAHSSVNTENHATAICSISARP